MATTFMFQPDWANSPDLSFNKPLSVSRDDAGREQRATSFKTFDFVREYTVTYLASTKFKARELEHVLSAGQGGTFLIPFYPEPLASSNTDYKGSFFFDADVPDWLNSIHSPNPYGDLTNIPFPGVPGYFTVSGNWRCVRFDYQDWSNYEVVNTVGWTISGQSVFLAFLGLFSKTIPLTRQTFHFMDEVMLASPPDITHLTDEQTVYTITWRSV